MISLAVKYRPQDWNSVIEQDTIKIILQQQLQSGNVKNAYLFCGPAGDGKTTCARIFANEINHGEGNPIELDAASHNGVDDVREVIKQAQTKSLDSEYKIFIIDECHSISNTGWQAFLKLLEEPPAKSVFIFCTTDPQRIPKTILSRVQRYDFSRISQFGIVQRLKWICDNEGITRYSDNGNKPDSNYADTSAIEYIAKIADGHLRDAITMLDKCLAYSKDLTLENVTKALGIADYSEMFKLLDSIVNKNFTDMLTLIESIYMNGKELKQFIKEFMNFVLDINKYKITKSFEFITIPEIYESNLNEYLDTDLFHLLNVLIRLNADLKWEQFPKSVIESTLLVEVLE